MKAKPRLPSKARRKGIMPRLQFESVRACIMRCTSAEQQDPRLALRAAGSSEVQRIVDDRVIVVEPASRVRVIWLAVNDDLRRLFITA